MTSDHETSSPIDLETLLPWTLNGRLSEVEAARVQRALAEGHLSQESLNEAVFAYELATERPDSATLAALAAGELTAQETEALESYLERPDAAGDRELVELARVALTDDDIATVGGAPVSVLAPNESSRPADFWRSWAMAATLLAMLLAAGWWATSRNDRAEPPAVSVVAVAELLPDDMSLRGGGSGPASVVVGDAGVALVLVVDADVMERSLTLSLRDAEGREIARLDAVELRADGSVQVQLSRRVAERTRRLLLLSTEPVPGTVVHEYSLRPLP